MAVIKIPDGKGGWIKLPTVKGEPGKDGNDGTEVTKEDVERALGHTVKKDVPADAKFTDTIVDISGKVDKVSGKGLSTNDYDNEDVQEVSKIKTKATRLDNSIEVTVGSGGDYSTINEALQELSRVYPTFNSQEWEVKATIKLLKGFVMEEQVFVEGLDLGWIEIVSEQKETTIKRSSLTSYIGFNGLGGSYFAFGVRNGTLPTIGCLFAMDSSGSDHERDGLVASTLGNINVTRGAGVINAARHGLSISDSSTADVRGAIFDGAGDQCGLVMNNSTLNARDASFNEAGANGVSVEHKGSASLFRATINNAGRDGVYVANGSRVSLNRATINNAGRDGVSIINGASADVALATIRNADRYSINAIQHSNVNASLAKVRKGEEDSPSDMKIFGGSTITTTRSTEGGTSQALNEVTENGIIFG